MPTSPASHLAGDAIEVQDRSLGNGPFSNHVPIELDRVVYDGGKLSDHQVNISYFGCTGLLGMPLADIENVLRNC